MAFLRKRLIAERTRRNPCKRTTLASANWAGSAGLQGLKSIQLRLLEGHWGGELATAIARSDQVLIDGGLHSGSACRPDVTDVPFSRAAQTIVTGRTMRKTSAPFHAAPFAKFGAVVGATPDLPTVGTLAIRTLRKLGHPGTSCRSRGRLCGGIKCASSEGTRRLAVPMQLGNATGRKGTSLVRSYAGTVL